MGDHSAYEYILSGGIKAEDIKVKYNNEAKINFKLKDYYNFCKIYTREFEYKKSNPRKSYHKNSNPRKSNSKNLEQKIGAFKNREDSFCKRFSFVEKKDSGRTIGRYRNCKVSDFPFSWLKDRPSWSNAKPFINNKPLTFENELEKKPEFTGVFKDKKQLKKYLEKLHPYSFAITAKIKLKAPYFSKDDDFYLLDNPVLKDHTFKLPMVRGSGWKGALARSARELINENLGNFLSFVRIWGLGSSEYRSLLESLKKENIEELREKVISFSVFELGLELNKDDINDIKDNPQIFLEKLSEELVTKNIKDNTLLPYLQPHRGRAIFYPTFFNKISYEVINPHDRRRRAGTSPIFYEVVPESTTGILQIIYIPHDGLFTEEQALKEQISKDLSFLCETIDKTAEHGIGAKTKLGWGTFELSDKKYCANNLSVIVKGWNKC